jgi:cyclophilin family peptidyl-prolyl cis-trans isomerase
MGKCDDLRNDTNAMNALSRLFATFRAPGSHERATHRTRRRHLRRPSSLIAGEALEPKQLMAVDVVNAFADQSLTTSAPVTIAITNQFDLTDVFGTVAKFETNAPLGGTAGLTSNDFYVELYDKSGAAGTITSGTVANFLSYVNDGSYDNSMIHRSVSDFVIQGGGFTAPSVAADQPGSDPVAIATKGTITNEPGNSNLRGTLAMAKLGGQPNSATSQWFVNQSDNTFLDTDNGGYAVFGEVLGDGMTVVDVLGSALTYDATTYYSNSAFSDLPLWNVNADNIVLPQDFVKIETITALTDESELMTYSVTTSDSGKLAATINAQGDLVLTPVAGQTGSVNVTVTATSKTDGSTVSDTFAVGLGGQGPEDPGLTLTAIESAGNTVLNRDPTGKLYAGNSPIYDTYNGERHLSLNPYTGYTVVAVEDLGTSGRKIVLQSTTEIIIWKLDENWKRDTATGYERVYITDTSGIDAQEALFGIDINGGGIGPQTPVLTDLETAGSVSLQRDADGNLYANGAAIYDTYNGERHLSLNPYTGFTVVAVEDLGAPGRKIVLQSATQIIVWNLDTNWKRDLGAGYERVYTTDTSGIDAQEALFGIDINGGGIGPQTPALTDLETAGSVSLQRDADGKLYADGIAIYDTYNGERHLSLNPYTGYTVVAAEDLGASGRKIILQSATQIIVWNLDTNWKRDLGAGYERVYTTDTSGIDAQEALFGIDINGGGIGPQTPALTDLETAGSVSLQRDADGKLYADGIAIYDTYNGERHLSLNPYTGYTVVAAEDLGASGRKIVLQSATQIIVWNLDENWKRDTTAGFERVYLSDTSGIDEQEYYFGVDINGGGVSQYLNLEAGGSVNLQRDVTGKLYANGAAIYDTYNGVRHLSLNPYPGYTVVAAENLGTSGNKIVLQSSTQLIIWSLDANWNRDTGAGFERVYLTDTSSIDAQEALFDIDINGGGIGPQTPVFTNLETAGSVALQRDASGKLYANGTAVYDTYNGERHLSLNPYTGYTVVAAEDLGDEGRKIVLQSSTQIIIWTLDVDWRRDIGAGFERVYLTDTSGIAAQEALFGITID